MKTLGILGGMGPVASSNFLQKFLKECQTQYGAVQDSDYPNLVLNSLSCDGFDETGVVDEDLMIQQLLHGVTQLEKAGVEGIVIPCNTVHLYHSIMQEHSKVPILHIAEATCQKIEKEGHKKVGVIASQTSLKEGLYSPHIKALGMSYVYPNQGHYPLINKVIENVMGENHGLSDLIALKELITAFKLLGADAVALACTELPLAIKQKDSPLPLFDCTQVLAEAAAEFAYGV